MDASEPMQVAAGAAQGYGLYQCEECANAIKMALKATGHRGQQLELHADDNRQYLICFNYNKGMTPITLNGRHLGIRVRDVIFDNLHPDGLSFGDWIKDFDAPCGVFIHENTDF